MRMAKAAEHHHHHDHDHEHDHEHEHQEALDPRTLSWIGKPAPAFTGKRIEWLAGDPVDLTSLKDKTLLVNIWDFASLNCVRTLPYLKAWHERYARDGLWIVGIHVPEFPFGADATRVKQAIRDLGIPYAVVSDPGLELMAAWRNVFWPRKWLVGSDGVVRVDHVGEGGYDEFEAGIRKVIGGAKDGRRWPEIMDPINPEDAPSAVCYPRSNELWCGHERGSFGGPGHLEQGLMHVYKDAPRHIDGGFYLTGAWEAKADRVVHGTPTAAGHPDALKIRFHGSQVHAVLGTESGTEVTADILLDGRKTGTVTAGSPNLHALLTLDAPGHHELELSVKEPGFSVWSFSFGSPVVPRR